MAYALFYNMTDMKAIVDEATNAKLTGTERQYMQRLSDAGLANWQNAPLAPENSPFYGEGLPDNPTHMFVVNGTGLTVQGLVDFLNDIARSKRAVNYFLEGIAADIRNTAVEPWPPVA